MKFLLILSSLIAGLAVGFAGTSWILDDLDQTWTRGYVNLDYASQTHLTWPFKFNEEWRMKSDRSQWLNKVHGSIDVYLPKRPHSDLILEIKARLDNNSASHFQEAKILIHDIQLGELKFKPGQLVINKEFRLPKEIAAKSKIVTIVFQTKVKYEPPSDPIIGVENISLKDLPQKSDFNGHVDSCNRQQISGWAAYEGVGITPIVKQNGRILYGVSSQLARPDLPKHGYPLKAGFRYKFRSPPNSGDDVQILFPDEGKIPGKRCSF